jgi:hypothetical protein
MIRTKCVLETEAGVFWGANRMNTRRNRRLRGGTAGGQGLLEFGLILPLLLILMFGVIEAGRLIATYVGVVSASREAARYGAGVGLTSSTSDLPPYLDCTEIDAAALRLNALANIGSITISYDNLLDGGSYAGCPPPMSQITLGTRIIVSTAATYQPIANFFGIPPIQVTSQTSRTIMKGIYLENY